MTVRQNSIDAYNTIKSQGLLSDLLWRIYAIIYKHGPLTGREIGRHYVNIYGGEPNLNQVRSKITMLKDKGVVMETGNTQCHETEMTVALYDVTSKLPSKPRKRSRKEIKAEALKTIKELGPNLLEEHRVKLRRIWHLVNQL